MSEPLAEEGLKASAQGRVC